MDACVPNMLRGWSIESARNVGKWNVYRFSSNAYRAVNRIYDGAYCGWTKYTSPVASKTTSDLKEFVRIHLPIPLFRFIPWLLYDEVAETKDKLSITRNGWKPISYNFFFVVGVDEDLPAFDWLLINLCRCFNNCWYRGTKPTGHKAAAYGKPAV